MCLVRSYKMTAFCSKFDDLDTYESVPNMFLRPILTASVSDFYFYCTYFYENCYCSFIFNVEIGEIVYSNHTDSL